MARQAALRASPLLRLSRAIGAAAYLVAGIVTFPYLLVCAAAGSSGSRRRRARGLPARLVWGATPIISIAYWSRALTARGYESTTFVQEVYPINKRSDFDLTYADFGQRGFRFRVFAPYRAFAWALRHADVVSCFFYGAFLGSTPFARLEFPLLRAAGKRIVVSPYGSDIAVPEFLGQFREPLLTDYPDLGRSGARRRHRVDHYARWASFVIKNMQVGYLPRHDMLWPNQIAIDTAQWQPCKQVEAEQHDHETVVAHSANHRAVKGTDIVIAAVERLRDEGMAIRLDLLERVPNVVVRERVDAADIVVEQLIGGYALAAIEAMSLGKPVLSNLSWHGRAFIESTCLRDCPIVDTDADSLVDDLRRLATSPELRRSLGRQGRAYVEQYHSYDAVGATWDAIFRHVWNGESVPVGDQANVGVPAIPVAGERK